jgi:hypothetical protein
MGCDEPLFDFLILAFQFDTNRCIGFVDFILTTWGYVVVAD